MEIIQNNSKLLDENLTITILNSCLNIPQNMEKIFPLLINYIKLNKTISNSFWVNVIEFFIKNNYVHLANELIKFYSVKVINLLNFSFQAQRGYGR